MIRATRVFPADAWSHVATDTVVLDFDHRRRRRLRMQGEGGLDFILDLPEAVAIRDGDGLLLEDGRIVAVKAADEPLLEVHASDAAHLTRLAWQLGNGHVPVQVEAGRLLVREEDGVAAMLAELDATTARVQAPFEPEGDVADNHDHVHGHHHSHDET